MKTKSDASKHGFFSNLLRKIFSPRDSSPHNGAVKNLNLVGQRIRTIRMEKHWTQNRLAKELHVSAPRINDVVRGKRGITADTAMRLSAYFGTSPQLWLNLQMDHDIWHAAKNKSLAKITPREQAA